MPRSFLIKKHQKTDEFQEGGAMESNTIEVIDICNNDDDGISDCSASSSEELCVLPTPPHTPESTACPDTPLSTPGGEEKIPRKRKMHKTRDETQVIPVNVEKDKKSENNYKFERRRDPIGQLLDSLCKANKSKNSNTNARTASHESAFTPIFKTHSPPTYLPTCDKFCVQGTVDYFHSPQSLNVFRRETMTPPQAPTQGGSVFAYAVQPPTQPHFHPSMVPNGIRNFNNARQLFPQQFPSDMFVPGYHSVQSPGTSQPFPVPWMSWSKNMSPAPQKFPDVTYKEIHPISHPPRYQCEACSKSYSTFGGLSKHKQFHCVSQIKKEFTCKYCDKTYGSLGALKMHIRTHTLPCKCKLCGKAFSRPWLLQGHLRTHTGEKPYRCEQCGRAFADRSNLRAHLQTHSDIKKYGCKMCSKTFSRMSLLLKHEEGSCSAMRR